MSLASRLLIHTCTVVQAGSKTSYGHSLPDWDTGTTVTANVPCRLVPAHERDLATGELLATHTLLLDYDAAPATLRAHGAASTHRITTVTWHADGTTLDAGPFDIQAVKDAGGAGRLLQLRLMRAG